jgi:hypothetical protein
VAGPDDEEEHVVLGRLTPGPGRVRAKVNSQRRLKRLLRILREIGAAPEVTEESRFEPSLDFAWGPVPGDGSAVGGRLAWPGRGSAGLPHPAARGRRRPG